MDVGEFERQLREEGFQHTYVWQDRPNAFYAEHSHAMDTAHIILDGEMTLTFEGVTAIYRAGDRAPDVPAGTLHSARIGPKGCRYLIGEK